MVIKTYGNKQTNFAQKVDYLISDKGEYKDLNEGFYFTQNMNIFSDDIKTADDIRTKIINDFKTQDIYRRQNKSSKIVYYHDKLSFKSSEGLTNEIVEDLIRKYVELRAENAVVFARGHIDNQEHPHVHVMYSNGEYRSKKALRADNEKFRRCRIEVEKYQKEMYPALNHSIVYDNFKNKEKQKGKSTRDMNKRAVRKREIGDIVMECYNQSDGYNDFISRLKTKGLETYNRVIKGKEVIYGVLSNGKHRFSSLGLGKEKIQELYTQEQDRELISKYRKEPSKSVSKFKRTDDEALDKYSKFRKVDDKEYSKFRKNQQDKEKGREMER